MWFAPAIVLAAPLIWGSDGAASAAVAIAIVLVNLALSALMLSWAARRSPSVLMAVALGGFAVRMGLVTGRPAAVQGPGLGRALALGVAVLVTSLGLLFWELRYVSASLAFPGLRPG